MILPYVCAVFLAAQQPAPKPAPKQPKPTATAPGDVLLKRLAKMPSFDHALAVVREGGTEAIRRGLGQRHTQRLLAWALTRHAVPAVRETLESLVASPDQVTGYYAAFALGAIGDARSVPVLASQLAEKPGDYWELVQRTKKGPRPIFRVKRRGGRKTFFAEPHHRNLRVAYAAVEALGHIGGAEAEKGLIRALASEQYLVRYGAVRGLGLIGESARPHLERVARADDRLVVREAARRALQDIERRGTPKSEPQAQARGPDARGATGGLPASVHGQVPTSRREPRHPAPAATQPRSGLRLAGRTAGGGAGRYMTPGPRDCAWGSDGLCDRLKRVPAIAFIKTRHRSDATFGFRDSYFFPKTPWFASGENIYTLTPPKPDGTLRNLTNLKKGAVQGLEVSPDGKRLLFAMRRNIETDGFHIFEMNVDGTGLRQITDGPCNDVDPAYLPDGSVVFSSDRDGTHEFYHQERVRTLCVVNADGSNLRQLTFNPNQDHEPLALRDGRIMYGSYRFYGQDGSGGVYPGSGGGIARIETHTRSVLPDGTGDRHLYGARRGSFYVPLRAMPDGDGFQAPQLTRNRDHLGVSVSHYRQMPDGRLICTTPAGLTLVDLAAHPHDCELPIFPEVVNLAGGEEVYIHNHDDLNPIGRYTTPYPIDNRTILVAHAPFYSRVPNAYGLYLFDLESRTQTLVYDDPAFAEVDVVPLVASGSAPSARGSVTARETVPPSIAETDANGETGEIFVQSVFNTDLKFDREAIRYLQVTTAEQLGAIMNANGGFRSRIIGIVPIESDGSVRVEVPADTPLHFSLLDIDENTLVHETAFMTVAPGEVRSCIGCHEPEGVAPPGSMSTAEALRHEPYRAHLQRNDLIYMGRPQHSYSVLIRR